MDPLHQFSQLDEQHPEGVSGPLAWSSNNPHDDLPAAGSFGRHSTKWMDVDNFQSSMQEQHGLSPTSSTQAVTDSFSVMCVASGKHQEDTAAIDSMDDNEATPRFRYASISSQEVSPDCQMLGSSGNVNFAPSSSSTHPPPHLPPRPDHIQPFVFNDDQMQTYTTFIGFDRPGPSMGGQNSVLGRSQLPLMINEQQSTRSHPEPNIGRVPMSPGVYDEKYGAAGISYGVTTGPKLIHGQRLVVRVRKPGGPEVQLFALICFNVRKSFIETEVALSLGFETHPVPLGKPQREFTPYGYCTPTSYACFEFSLPSHGIVGASTNILTMESIDRLNHMILGRSFLQRALGYEFPEESLEVRQPHHWGQPRYEPATETSYFQPSAAVTDGSLPPTHTPQYVLPQMRDRELDTASKWSSQSEASSNPASRLWSDPTLSSTTSAAEDPFGFSDDAECGYGAGRPA